VPSCRALSGTVSSLRPPSHCHSALLATTPTSFFGLCPIVPESDISLALGTSTVSNRGQREMQISAGLATTWVPSLVFILICWIYAFHLSSSSFSSSSPPAPQLHHHPLHPPSDSRGDLQWKREYSFRVTEEIDLISKRTQVSSASVDQTLHQLYFDEKQLKIPNGHLFIPRNGIQISTNLSLHRLQNRNRTKLLFPVEFYSISGTHSPTAGQQSNVIVYLVSKSSSLQSYQQFFHSLQRILYRDEVILLLPPSDFKNPEIRTYLQSLSFPTAPAEAEGLNLVIYPYLMNCGSALGRNPSLCLLYDSMRFICPPLLPPPPPSLSSHLSLLTATAETLIRSFAPFLK
jgi:hypothetical protein